MFRPALVSFSLLGLKEKLSFLGLILLRVSVHALDLLGLAAVGLVGAMVSGSLNQQRGAEFLGFTVSIESTHTYIWVVGAIAGFFVGKSILAVVMLRATTMFLSRVEADASMEVAEYLFSGDLDRMRSRSKGEIQWLVYTATQNAFSNVLFSGAAIVTEAALFVSIVVMFFTVDPATALILVSFFASVIGLFQLFVSKRLKRLGKGTARFEKGVNNSVLDLIGSFREATVTQKRDWFLDRLDQSRRGLARNRGHERFAMSVPRYLIESSLIIGLLALTFGQFAAGADFSSLAIIGVFLVGGTRMMAALLPLQNAINEIRVVGPRASRAQEIIAMARLEAPRPDPDFAAQIGEISLDSRGVSVQVKDVCFTYPDSVDPVLENVSFAIKPGQFAALVGPSGAGKTTLADLILGTLGPTEGSINTAGASPKTLQALYPGLVSYVPQQPGMISGTLAQNVALGVDLVDIDDDRVVEVLGQVGLDELVCKLPQGINTSVGEHSDALSGGQIQRIGIARALYTRPKLLVLDEATSALDAEVEASLAQTIDNLRGQATVIVIAHRLSTIQHADVVFVIEGGALVAEGTFYEVRKQAPIIERYVQLMTIEESKTTPSWVAESSH